MCGLLLLGLLPLMSSPPYMVTKQKTITMSPIQQSPVLQPRAAALCSPVQQPSAAAPFCSHATAQPCVALTDWKEKRHDVQKTCRSMGPHLRSTMDSPPPGCRDAASPGGGEEGRRAGR